MTTSRAQISTTPILDLLKPLPKSDQERINGRFAFPFLTMIAAIVVIGNLSFLAVPFGFLLINFLVTAIHELGHVIAGWCVGFRFTGVRIDPFSLKLDSDKWKLKVHTRLFGGLAFMSLDRICRIRRRLLWITAGGPLASILSGIVAMVAGEFLRARYDSSWATFLGSLGFLSFLIGCISLIPFRAGRHANDGMVLRALLFSKKAAAQVVASHALTRVKNSSILPPDYVRRWYQLAAVQTQINSDTFHTNWLAYEAAEERESAAQFLEHCLAGSEDLSSEERDKLIAEAAFFTAWRRDSAEKAEIWAKRILVPDKLGAIANIRIRVAMMHVRRQYEGALSELAGGLALIRQSPKSAERQRFEAEWISWRQEIRPRASAAPLEFQPLSTSIT